MWSHLKVCKKLSFVVDKKQNILVLEPNKAGGESGDRSVGTLKTIGYDYHTFESCTRCSGYSYIHNGFRISL